MTQPHECKEGYSTTYVQFKRCAIHSPLGSNLLMQLGYTVRHKGKLPKHHGEQRHPRGPDVTGLPFEVTLGDYVHTRSTGDMYSTACNELMKDTAYVHTYIHTSGTRGCSDTLSMGLPASKNPLLCT